jgi:hypothetical protein
MISISLSELVSGFGAVVAVAIAYYFTSSYWLD